MHNSYVCVVLPREAMLAQYMGLYAMTLCLSVSICFCFSPVGVLSKRLNESSWFWHGSFIRCVTRKFGYLRKLGHFHDPSETLFQTLDLDLLWICCTTCFYNCAAVYKILTDSASRGPSAVAELLVTLMYTQENLPN